jgi:hypothetical protein
MLHSIEDFLRNGILLNWIAPILGTIIGAIGIKLLIDRYKSKSVISIINIANNRFVDAIRPFFIEEIEIDMKIVINIRNAIKREYCADDDMIYTIEQLKEQIILDISETKYLSEERKKQLIHNVYLKFDNFQTETDTDIVEEQTELIKYEINKLRVNNYYLAIISVLIIVMAIILLISFFYTLNFNNLYWLIIILPLILFIAEMITENVVQNKRIKKSMERYQTEKTDVKVG